MIRARTLSGGKITGWPRTSGDDPTVNELVDMVERLAPHERG